MKIWVKNKYNKICLPGFSTGISVESVVVPLVASVTFGVLFCVEDGVFGVVAEVGDTFVVSGVVEVVVVVELVVAGVVVVLLVVGVGVVVVDVIVVGVVVVEVDVVVLTVLFGSKQVSQQPAKFSSLYRAQFSRTHPLNLSPNSHPEIVHKLVKSLYIRPLLVNLLTLETHFTF